MVCCFVNFFLCNERHIKAMNIARSTPTVRVVVCMDSTPDATTASDTFSLVSFASVEQRGRSTPHPFVPPHPDDLATIMYTSGTTGDPKVCLCACVFACE